MIYLRHIHESLPILRKSKHLPSPPRLRLSRLPANMVDFQNPAVVEKDFRAYAP